MTTNVFKSSSQKLAHREILLMASSWKRETQREIPSYGNLTATMTTVVVGSLLRICKDWRGNDRFWKLLSFTCIHVSRVSNSFISKCYYVIITEWRTVSFGSSNSWWVADSNRKTDRQTDRERREEKTIVEFLLLRLDVIATILRQPTSQKGRTGGLTTDGKSSCEKQTGNRHLNKLDGMTTSHPENICSYHNFSNFKTWKLWQNK